MPQYYFHLSAGEVLHDHHGIELPDIVSARCEAERRIAKLIEPHPAVDTGSVSLYPMAVMKWQRSDLARLDRAHWLEKSLVSLASRL